MRWCFAEGGSTVVPFSEREKREKDEGMKKPSCLNGEHESFSS